MWPESFLKILLIAAHPAPKTAEFPDYHSPDLQTDEFHSPCKDIVEKRHFNMTPSVDDIDVFYIKRNK